MMYFFILDVKRDCVELVATDLLLVIQLIT